MGLISGIVAAVAHRELSRVMRFDEGLRPEIPEPDSTPRLLYLHIPFCERLCPYCSFHRVAFQDKLARDYFRALRREIALYRERGFDFRAIYVGGGTPTVLASELEETLNIARRSFRIGEISVETNPNHLTEEVLAALKRAGVNRLSVGVQSFDNGMLKAMNRFDKYGSGEEIAERLKAGLGRFDTLNADMIFNLPGQDETMLERDLDILLACSIDQVTFYPLMVSDATRGQVADTLGRVDYRKEERFYRRIVGRLVPTYSFSSAWCFSRKSGAAAIDEYIVGYDEYAGLGSGSIGYLKGTCYANTFDIPGYIAWLDRGETALWSARRFSDREQMRYDFLIKLFSTRLDLATVEAKFGGAFLRRLWPEVSAFQLAGGLRREGDSLVLTERGRYLWVVMMREFFIAVNNLRDACRAGIPR